MSKNNYHKATITVGVASLGFLAAYPFHATFWGGFVSSGCSAAMIGGLADWFAVTALFRRPLGVKPGRVIRTEIIPRNRERIFTALANMVQNELFTPQVLKQRLGSYDISQMLLRYLEEHGGREDVDTILAYVIKDILAKLEPQGLDELAEKVIVQGGAGLKISPILVKLFKYSLIQGYEEKLTNFLLDQLISLTKHPQTGVIIFQLIKEALETYEKGRDRRRFVNELLLQLSPVSLAELAQAKLIEFLEEVKYSKEHPLRQKVREKIVDILDALENDLDLQQRVENWKNQNLSKLNLSEEINRLFANKNKLPDEQIIRRAQAELKQILDKFRENQTMQAKLDHFMKELVIDWIDDGHPLIGRLVRDNLEKFSNQRLVDLLEEKAGNDLQMIRINGTVVGGLVGLLIYLGTFWLG